MRTTGLRIGRERHLPTSPEPLTQAFILVPGPYAMALFTFIAQPLFAIVAIGYLLKVRTDLRKRGL